MADRPRRQANNSNNIILQLVEEENPATTSIRNNSMILGKCIGKEREQNQCFSPCCPVHAPLQSRQDLRPPQTRRPSLFIGADIQGTTIQNSRAAWVTHEQSWATRLSFPPPTHPQVSSYFERASPSGHPRHHRA